MAESRTGPIFGHIIFNCNICCSFTQRTSQSCLNHSQEPCEWVDADLQSAKYGTGPDEAHQPEAKICTGPHHKGQKAAPICTAKARDSH